MRARESFLFFLLGKGRLILTFFYSHFMEPRSSSIVAISWPFLGQPENSKEYYRDVEVLKYGKLLNNKAHIARPEITLSVRAVTRPCVARVQHSFRSLRRDENRGRLLPKRSCNIL